MKNSSFKVIVLLLFSLIVSVSYSIKVYSGTVLKVAVLAPEGTSWASNLKKMSKEVSDATKGDLTMRIYFGGAQGDEPDVLRKIRIGQLHGGFFTGKTLGDLFGDVRLMEVPFSFRENKEIFDTLEKMKNHFNKGIEKEQFINLGFFNIGFVYLVSKKNLSSIADMKGLKIWSWSGDPLAEEMIKTMQLVSVPLPLPDVLSALSTGIVEAAYSPPLGILSLQWNTKVKYMLDLPITFSVGAFLLGSKIWGDIPEKHRSTFKTIADKYFAEINIANEKENTESLKIMKSMGMQFVNFPEKEYAQGIEIRKTIIKNLKGKLFTESGLKLFESVYKTKK